MTAFDRARPLMRPPPLAETPALARLAVAAGWLLIGIFGRPLSVAFLVVVSGAVLVAASGYSIAALWRVSWRAMVLIALAGLAAFVVSIDSGRPAAIEAALSTCGPLLLILIVVLLVVLPQDAEAAVDESIVLLHAPPRLAFELLVMARVVTAMPRDFTAHRQARRAHDMARRGIAGMLIEPLEALLHVVRAARHRLRALRTTAQLAALGSGPLRTTYRSVSFGRNGRYVLVGGLIVALSSLVIGLL